MYAEYFGFAYLPFNSIPEPGRVYPQRTFVEAHERLRQGAERGAVLMLLTGVPGVGKTTLLRKLQVSLEERGFAVVRPHVSYARPGSVQAGRGPVERASRTHGAAGTGGTIALPIEGPGPASGGVVVVVDDAHSLQDRALHSLLALCSVRRGTKLGTTLILAGTPDLTWRLNGFELATHGRGADLVCTLAPMDGDDVGAYIRHRLRAAGHHGPSLFDEDAVRGVERHGGGIPRRIDAICGMALLIACDAGRSIVDGATLNEAVEDLEGTEHEACGIAGHQVFDWLSADPGDGIGPGLPSPVVGGREKLRRLATEACSHLRAMLAVAGRMRAEARRYFQAARWRVQLGRVRVRRDRWRAWKWRAPRRYPSGMAMDPLPERDFLILKAGFVAALLLPLAAIGSATLLWAPGRSAGEPTASRSSTAVPSDSAIAAQHSPPSRQHDPIEDEHRRIRAALSEAQHRLARKEAIIEEQKTLISQLRERMPDAPARDPAPGRAAVAPSPAGPRPDTSTSGGEALKMAVEPRSAPGARATATKRRQHDGSRATGPTAGSAADGADDVAPGIAVALEDRGPVHIVVAGDTLFAIARRYDVTVPDLRRWNGLASNRLRIGQVIYLVPRTHAPLELRTQLLSAAGHGSR